MDTTVTPLISVVLPAYNAAAYLPVALQSMADQTFGRLEVICINDGSTDETASILDRFSAGDKRFRAVHFQSNRGLVAALNEGIKEARGKYIARMDADDESLPDRLQRQFEFMEQHPEVGICGMAMEWMHNGKIIQLPEHHDDIVCRGWRESPFAHPTVILRAEVLRKHSLCYEADAFPAEDFDLWVRLLSLSRGYNFPEVGLRYRVHEAQISSKGNTKQTNAAHAVIERQVIQRTHLTKGHLTVVSTTRALAGTTEPLSTEELLAISDGLSCFLTHPAPAHDRASTHLLPVWFSCLDRWRPARIIDLARIKRSIRSTSFDPGWRYLWNRWTSRHNP